MKTLFPFSLLLVGALSFSLSTQADETFTQNGQQYVLKSNVVGVIRKPANQFNMSAKESEAAQKSKTFFDIQSTSALKAQGPETQKKFRVVYKQVTNPETHEVQEIPALLTGDVVVEAKNKNDFNLNTSLKLKKSFKENGFYVYQLPADKSVAEVLNELSKDVNVGKAQVEIIEHLRVPM